MIVEEFLKKNNIEYILHEHDAVFTVQEAEECCGDIPGIPCKNLFLRDKKRRRYFLFILPSEARANFEEIAEIVGEKKISFANETDLMNILGLERGAVSPFGLINDTDKRVELYVHKDVYDSDIVHFHPNRNTASLELTQDMFRRFVEVLDYKINIWS